MELEADEPRPLSSRVDAALVAMLPPLTGCVLHGLAPVAAPPPLRPRPPRRADRRRAPRAPQAGGRAHAPVQQGRVDAGGGAQLVLGLAGLQRRLPRRATAPRGARAAPSRRAGHVGARRGAPGLTARASRLERHHRGFEPDVRRMLRPRARQDDVLRRAVAVFNGKNWKKIGAPPHAADTRAAGARRRPRVAVLGCLLLGPAPRRAAATRAAPPRRRQARRRAHAPRVRAAEYFADRSDVQCLHRWQKVLNPDLVKGPWTQQARGSAAGGAAARGGAGIRGGSAPRGARRAQVVQP